MTHETDSKVIFVVFLTVFLGLIAVAAYFGLSGDWRSFILGGVTVYLLRFKVLIGALLFGGGVWISTAAINRAGNGRQPVCNAIVCLCAALGGSVGLALGLGLLG